MTRLAIIAALLLSGPAAAQGLAFAPSADVRSAVVVLDGSGNATWDLTSGGTIAPFGGAPDVTHIPQAVDSINPLICNYTARTASAVSIHCWRTNTLGLLTALLGGVTTGLQVSLVARYIPG